MWSPLKKTNDRTGVVIGVPRSFRLSGGETDIRGTSPDSWKTLEMFFSEIGVHNSSRSLCWLLERVDHVASSEDLPVSLWVHDTDDRVHYSNSRFVERYGSCTGWKCHSSVMGNPGKCSCCKSRRAFSFGEGGCCRLCRRFNLGYDVYVVHHLVFNTSKKPYLVTTSLQLETRAEVKSVLAGRSRLSEKRTAVFTCCSGCNKVKTDKGEWLAVDEYLLEMFTGRISHGICQECIERIYPYLDISE